jgi:hypothetical protein
MEGLKERLAQSNMKKYPKLLHDEVHVVEPSLRKDMHPL